MISHYHTTNTHADEVTEDPEKSPRVLVVQADVTKMSMRVEKLHTAVLVPQRLTVFRRETLIGLDSSRPLIGRG